MDVTEHLDQSDHNAQLSTHLDPDTSSFVDWNITATFYEAVHYIDAYAVMVEGACPYNSHFDRDRWMRNHLSPIRADYRILKLRSIDARYMLHHSMFTSEAERQRAQQLRSDELERIKQHLKGQGLALP